MSERQHRPIRRHCGQTTFEVICPLCGGYTDIDGPRFDTESDRPLNPENETPSRRH
jgi:rRNA maturation protein Nop10